MRRGWEERRQRRDTEELSSLFDTAQRGHTSRKIEIARPSPRHIAAGGCQRRIACCRGTRQLETSLVPAAESDLQEGLPTVAGTRGVNATSARSVTAGGRTTVPACPQVVGLVERLGIPLSVVSAWIGLRAGVPAAALALPAHDLAVGLENRLVAEDPAAPGHRSASVDAARPVLGSWQLRQPSTVPSTYDETLMSAHERLCYGGT